MSAAMQQKIILQYYMTQFIFNLILLNANEKLFIEFITHNFMIFHTKRTIFDFLKSLQKAKAKTEWLKDRQ